jgi:hypothetical protein
MIVRKCKMKSDWLLPLVQLRFAVGVQVFEHVVVVIEIVLKSCQVIVQIFKLFLQRVEAVLQTKTLIQLGFENRFSDTFLSEFQIVLL